MLSPAVVLLGLMVGLWSAQAQTIQNQVKFDEAVATCEAGDYVTAIPFLKNRKLQMEPSQSVSTRRLAKNLKKTER